MKKSSGNIVRRYSKALFESALMQQSVNSLSEEAQGWAKVFSPDFISFFVNPGISPEIKKQLISEICEAQKSSKTLLNFFLLLLNNNRFFFIVDVLNDFVKKCDDHLQIARVEITTAVALSPEEQESFRVTLVEAVKKQVILSCKVDVSIKAGCIVKIANTLVDSSLRSRLQSLKESLSQGV